MEITPWKRDGFKGASIGFIVLVVSLMVFASLGLLHKMDANLAYSLSVVFIQIVTYVDIVGLAICWGACPEIMGLLHFLTIFISAPLIGFIVGVLVGKIRRKNSVGQNL